jgi:UDP-GlcNAc:undecaprenyl-phosphate GlcNAc-1-phosphate transferase
VAPPILSVSLIGAVSFAVAAMLTPAVARLAVARGWLDQPDGLRKVHAAPIPAVGGVAVFVAFGATLLAFAMVGQDSLIGALGHASPYLPLLAAGFVVGAVGLLDDVRGVSPLAKLAVQVGAALFLYVQGFQIQAVSSPWGGSIELGVLALPVTLLWLVGMSNAFNLIDGLDGLAAGLGLVSTLGLLAAAVLNDRWETVALAAALAGALLGFLPYNFNPARVFLGDCGSLAVGFTLAAIAMQSSIKSSAAIAVAVPLLALALPILDVGLAVVRRFVRRRPVFGADRNHIHHRLISLGLTPRRAVVTMYGVATLFTALALAAAVGPRQVGWAAMLVVLLLIVLGVRALGYWELTEFQRSFAARLAAGVRPAGDAALRGLEEDFAGMRTLDAGWRRLCETAWTLGFKELHVVPQQNAVKACPELHALAPPYEHGAQLPREEAAIWSFFAEIDGQLVAEVVARRPLDRVDFEPGRFVAAVEGLLSLGLTSPEAVGSSEVALAHPVAESPRASPGPVPIRRDRPGRSWPDHRVYDESAPVEQAGKEGPDSLRRSGKRDGGRRAEQLTPPGEL